MLGSYRGENWKIYREEDWLDHHLYLISDYGRIQSLKDKFVEGKFINGGHLNGYLTIMGKRKNGKGISRYVHKIVAQLFLPEPRPDQTFVIHLDYDKLNNHYTNLAWASKAERMVHDKKNPNYLAKKDDPCYSKLTIDRVRIIKKKLLDPKRKTRMKMLAKQYGVTEMQLWRIKSGENWGHVKVD